MCSEYDTSVHVIREKRVDIVFFFNDTATTEIYTLSLHDALPISRGPARPRHAAEAGEAQRPRHRVLSTPARGRAGGGGRRRSEEHTSELQSRQYLVCRLLLEKKNKDSHHLSRPYAVLLRPHTRRT